LKLTFARIAMDTFNSKLKKDCKSFEWLYFGILDS
jgi:hypothetical protein